MTGGLYSTVTSQLHRGKKVSSDSEKHKIGIAQACKKNLSASFLTGLELETVK